MPTKPTKRINVTQRDIDKGIRRNCEMCPVARAMSRAFKSDVMVDVETWDFVVGRRKRNPLPREVVLFIEDFDNEEPQRSPLTLESRRLRISPFSFTVNL